MDIITLKIPGVLGTQYQKWGQRTNVYLFVNHRITVDLILGLRQGTQLKRGGARIQSHGCPCTLVPDCPRHTNRLLGELKQYLSLMI